MAVVRLSPWAAWAIVGLTVLVLAGMGQVWDLVARRLIEPWGVALAVLGNAYIVSGLVAAWACGSIASESSSADRESASQAVGAS